LVLVREEPFRQVLFGFDLHESDLPLRIAFPILAQNLSEWMLPPSVPSHSFHPDEPVTIVPETGATSVNVIRPDGNRRSIAPGSRSPRSASWRPNGWRSTVGFELTRPLFLGAGVLALGIIVAIWRVFPPPLPRVRARLSLGLRLLIVLLLTASLAGFQVQTTPSRQSLLVAADLSASVQSALDNEAATVRRILQQR